MKVNNLSSPNNYNILRPFGPPIGKFSIPKEIVSKINNYIDLLIQDDLKVKHLNVAHTLEGQVTQEILLPTEIVEGDLVELFTDFTSKFIFSTTSINIKNFSLLHCWVVRQFRNEYNPIHWHTGHISGAGWLKLPKSFGNAKKDKRNNPNGKLNFIHGSKQFLSNPRIEVIPEVGEVCIFPHYLMHEVYPFQAEGERRSISFNALVDDDIFNISSKKRA